MHSFLNTTKFLNEAIYYFENSKQNAYSIVQQFFNCNIGELNGMPSSRERDALEKDFDRLEEIFGTKAFNKAVNRRASVGSGALDPGMGRNAISDGDKQDQFSGAKTETTLASTHSADQSLQPHALPAGTPVPTSPSRKHVADMTPEEREAFRKKGRTRVANWRAKKREP